MESTVLSRPIKKESRNYFKTHMKILKYFGVSLEGNDTITYKLYSFLILSSTVFAYTILTVYELFKQDAETAFSFINHVAAYIATLIKVSITLVNRVKFGKLLRKLEQEPILPDSKRGDEEEKLMQECIWRVNVQSYAIWIATSAALFADHIYAISTRLRSNDYLDWKLPYVPVTHMNVTYSPNYEIALIYQFFSAVVTAGLYVTIDLIIATVLIHISFQFKILQHFLKHIVEHSYEEMLKDTDNVQSTTKISSEIDGSIIPYKYLQKSLKKAVRYHLAILDIAKEMEEFFRYLLLLAFLVSLACLSFHIFQASSLNSALGLLRYVVEFLDAVFPILMVCYWGEEILFESQQVGDAAYQANFVGTDLRFQKSLLLIMRRSQNPAKLTAGKFTNICLATFVWIMNTSYSAFMLLRNLKGDEI